MATPEKPIVSDGMNKRVHHDDDDEDPKRGGTGGTVRRRVSHVILRFMATVTTMVAAILAGAVKENELVSVTIFPGLPPITIPATAQTKLSSGGVYFMITNAIACAYAASSLVVLLATTYKCRRRRKDDDQKSKRSMEVLMIIMDVVMVGLLSSGNGAAGALGVVAYKGNPHVQWNKFCNIFEKYCHEMLAPALLSLMASFIFVVLVISAVLNLHSLSMSH